MTNSIAKTIISFSLFFTLSLNANSEVIKPICDSIEGEYFLNRSGAKIENFSASRIIIKGEKFTMISTPRIKLGADKKERLRIENPKYRIMEEKIICSGDNIYKFEFKDGSFSPLFYKLIYKSKDKLVFDINPRSVVDKLDTWTKEFELPNNELYTPKERKYQAELSNILVFSDFSKPRVKTTYRMIGSYRAENFRSETAFYKSGNKKTKIYYYANTELISQKIEYPDEKNEKGYVRETSKSKHYNYAEYPYKVIHTHMVKGKKTLNKTYTSGGEPSNGYLILREANGRLIAAGEVKDGILKSELKLDEDLHPEYIKLYDDNGIKIQNIKYDKPIEK